MLYVSGLRHEVQESILSEVPGLKEEVDGCLSEAARIVDIDLRAFESLGPCLRGMHSKTISRSTMPAMSVAVLVSNFLKKEGRPVRHDRGIARGSHIIWVAPFPLIIDSPRCTMSVILPVG